MALSCASCAARCAAGAAAGPSGRGRLPPLQRRAGGVPRPRLRAASSSSSSAAAGGAQGEALDLASALAAFDARPGTKIWFSAERSGSTAVEEKDGWRSLGEYMALPVSQYSVLDGATIVRLSEDTFELSLEALKFFSFTLKPVLIAQVVTKPEGGCCIQVLDVTLRGPKLIEAFNGTFFIDSSNEVSLTQATAGDGQEILSEAHVRVGIVVPKWNMLPLGLVERTGSALMAATLAVVVPRFLKQLAEDYAAWGAGDDSRSAKSTGQSAGTEAISVGE